MLLRSLKRFQRLSQIFQRYKSKNEFYFLFQFLNDVINFVENYIFKINIVVIVNFIYFKYFYDKKMYNISIRTLL